LWKRYFLPLEHFYIIVNSEGRESISYIVRPQASELTWLGRPDQQQIYERKFWRGSTSPRCILQHVPANMTGWPELHWVIIGIIMKCSLRRVLKGGWYGPLLWEKVICSRSSLAEHCSPERTNCSMALGFLSLHYQDETFQSW
jgi:hypothetical protein